MMSISSWMYNFRFTFPYRSLKVVDVRIGPGDGTDERAGESDRGQPGERGLDARAPRVQGIVGREAEHERVSRRIGLRQDHALLREPDRDGKLGADDLARAGLRRLGVGGYRDRNQPREPMIERDGSRRLIVASHLAAVAVHRGV